MRGLTVKQKKALTKAVLKFVADNNEYPCTVEVLPEFQDIENMNCTEVFFQYADMFIHDLRFSMTVNIPCKHFIIVS